MKVGEEAVLGCYLFILTAAGALSIPDSWLMSSRLSG